MPLPPSCVHSAAYSRTCVCDLPTRRGYNDVAANAYTVDDNNVGGSADCLAAIKDGHQSIGVLAGTLDGRTKLAKLFGNSAAWYVGLAIAQSGGKKIGNIEGQMQMQMQISRDKCATALHLHLHLHLSLDTPKAVTYHEPTVM